ncbi:laminin domain protein, putative [Rhizoctonia solani AG-3 Rhs1AP]|uniref:Laminin domain protein, putative n=1 Tax=Rhizoctonia solani AG-3 Rhs1AP TaxID=1086054 RepID=A0A0A1UJP7_9AGAM|nr:laminin domain protein, putative [Rhizoctonia solani AG-3 Rhs1AP]
MAHRPGWYPPGQVCYPPQLPASLRSIHDLKPIVGVPSDDEVISIHTVMHVASRVSGVPEMHDPKFFMQLADHLFDVQMARYRSRYSLITFPSDATYTPPALPTHISVNLEPVSGAPSDDEMSKVHEAIQTYQELRRIPSLFDARVNMELSQHLFDLQMARHMRVAGESEPRPVLQATEPVHSAENEPASSAEAINTTNNAGTGANTIDTHHIPQPVPGIDVRELMERSNQLAERFNQLLERSNELVERCAQPIDRSHSPTLSEQFNQVLERLTALVEQPRPPTEHSDPLAERFNQLFERFNQLVEQSSEPAHKANKLTERSHELAEKANQLMQQLGKSSQRSNELAKQTKSSWDGIGDVLGNINRVLVGVQHAIVRNHKGNTTNAIDCLVNEQGRIPMEINMYNPTTVRSLLDPFPEESEFSAVVIDGARQDYYIPNGWLGHLLRFYGFHEGFSNSTDGSVLDSTAEYARYTLNDYFSSCLG